MNLDLTRLQSSFQSPGKFAPSLYTGITIFNWLIESPRSLPVQSARQSTERLHPKHRKGVLWHGIRAGASPFPRPVSALERRIRTPDHSHSETAYSIRALCATLTPLIPER